MSKARSAIQRRPSQGEGVAGSPRRTDLPRLPCLSGFCAACLSAVADRNELAARDTGLVRFVAAACLMIGCGGGEHPVESPATVVQVEEQPQQQDEMLDEPIELPDPRSLLERLADEHCKGMERVGPAVWLDLVGDTATEKPITLSPGKCYTIIASAPDGHEIDLIIKMAMASMPVPMPLSLAQGMKHESASVVGGEGRCFKQPMPIPMPTTIEIRSPSGATRAELLICRK